MKLRAIVPVQDFRRAKSRLGDALDPDARAALAERLAAHVIETLRTSAHVTDVLVVSPSDDVRLWATERGARATADAVGAVGLAAVVDASIAEMEAPTLVVMSDLPLLGHADIDALVDAARGADVVVGTDTAGLGTNALLLTKWMPTCFGNVDSAYRHRARAASLGLIPAIVAREGIGCDVDLAEHLVHVTPKT